MQLVKTRHALPFIIRNQQKNIYELTKQAQQLLKSIDKNISVISVIGPCKTGKSYLLNNIILDKKDIFKIGNTQNSCTKGLWIWIQPDPSNQKRSMIVIDSEGFNKLYQISNYQIKIFSLVVLLSCTVIFNCMGCVEEWCLKMLSQVLDAVKQIDKDNQLGRIQLIWVIRDFVTQVVEEGVEQLMGGEEYLNKILPTNENDKIRQNISKHFLKKDCYPLIKPLSDEKQLKNLSEMIIDKIRPQFISKSIELRMKIKSNLQQYKFKLSKNNITGKQYVIIIKKYLDEINGNGINNGINMEEFIKETKAKETLEQIRKIYSEKIKTKITSKIPMKRSSLQQLLTSMKEQAKALFLKTSDDKTFLHNIDQIFINALDKIQKINTSQNKIHIKNILNKQYQQFDKKLCNNYYTTYQQYQKDIQQNYKYIIINKYIDKIDEIKQYIDQFCNKKLIQNFKWFQFQFKNQIKYLKGVRDQMEICFKREITSINNIQSKQKNCLQEKIIYLEKQLNVSQLQRQHLLQLTKNQQILHQNTLSQLQAKYSQLTSTLSDKNKQIATLHSIQNQLKQRCFIEYKQHQKQHALFQQKQQFINNKVKLLQNKCSQYLQIIKEDNCKFQVERKGMIKGYSQKVNGLEELNKKLLEKIAEIQIKLTKSHQQSKQLSTQLHLQKQLNSSHFQKLSQTHPQLPPSKPSQQLLSQNIDLQQQLQKMTLRYKQQSKKLKIVQDQFLLLQNHSQNQIAIYLQKISFLQIQINDFKSRYQDAKKSYQLAIGNLNGGCLDWEYNISHKIYQIYNNHQQQIKQLEIQNQKKNNLLKTQIQLLQQQKQQLQTKQQQNTKNSQLKQTQHQQSINIKQTMIKQLLQKIKISQQCYLNTAKQQQVIYSNKITSLQHDILSIKQQFACQLHEKQQVYQQSITTLKTSSQLSIQQCQKRFLDQKHHLQNKHKQLIQQLQKNHLQQYHSCNLQISQLQNRLVHMQRIYNQQLYNIQYNHNIQKQKNQKLFCEQKCLFQKNISTMKNFYDAELIQKQKKWEKDIYLVKQQYQNIINKLQNAKHSIQQNLQNSKKTNTQLNSHISMIKNEGDKERMIWKQKQKYLDKKIIQLQNRLQIQLNSYTKNLQTAHETHQKQITSLTQQITTLQQNLTSSHHHQATQQSQHQVVLHRLQTKIKTLQDTKHKNKLQYQDMVNKFENVITHLNQQKKKIINQKDKEKQNIGEKVGQYVKQLQNNYQKILKEQSDKINKLTNENLFLKQKMTMVQTQKQIPIKRILTEQNERDKLDKKYEKNIDEYKQMYQKQKQKTKKLKHQNWKFKGQINESNSNFYQGYLNNYFDCNNNGRVYQNLINTVQSKKKIIYQKQYGQLSSARFSANGYKTRQ